jgi:hypothetical protein
MSWDRFLDEFVRRPNRDGPDLGALDALTPPEREQAFFVLLAAAQHGSVPAIQGLTHLRDDRAAAPLRALMTAADGTVRVYAAAAVWWLRRDPEALATLCHETVHRPRLRGAKHRVDAAAVLSQIDDDAARRALARVIHDPEYHIRYHAYEGLGPVLGRKREIWNYVCKPDVHHHVRARVDAILRRAGLL